MSRMAGIGVSPIVLLSLLLLAIGGAHATIFFPRPLTVTGQLCCTQNGNCPGTPVAGATVTLNCPGSILSPPVSVSTTTTATGTFSLSAIRQSITGLTIFVGCTITVQLPVPATAACPVLSNTGGILISLIRRTGEVGGVQLGVPTGFVRLG
ncbi:hypothetical protein SASPL_109927 [Salvia splendens]|uniref:Uncharacterized protein n=1 Tax=Salvia splendens TaxID=180675 RepID=A0A8X8YJN1_SALSN|nr:uncharacterized protein LOC121796408 [Salvia splendens]KAG6431837.1 hypothetical protein SASPL_109922 [Salvia splendens]KAG6431842.1 hypothetical protein SASPL_109927 [Salvia splendens]